MTYWVVCIGVWTVTAIKSFLSQRLKYIIWKVQPLTQAARKTQQCYSNTNCPAVEGFTLRFRERKWLESQRTDAVGLQLVVARDDHPDLFLLKLESVDKQWSWQLVNVPVLSNPPPITPDSIKGVRYPPRTQFILTYSSSWNEWSLKPKDTYCLQWNTWCFPFF